MPAGRGVVEVAAAAVGKFCARSGAVRGFAAGLLATALAMADAKDPPPGAPMPLPHFPIPEIPIRNGGLTIRIPPLVALALVGF